MVASDRLPLSIIIPVFNRSDQLRRALLSLLAQETYPIATIVVDDGSDTPITIDEDLFAPLGIKLIRHGINQGAAAARNTGLLACETDWIGFLDSDDVLLENSLALRWRHLVSRQRRSSNKSKVIYACGWIEVTEDGQELSILFPRPSADPVDFASGCWFSPGSCVLLNRRAALDVGPQDEKMARLEDFDWFLRLALDGCCLEVLPVIGARIERRRGRNPREMRAVAARILEKWRSSQLRPGFLRRISAYVDLEIASAYFHAGQRTKCLGYLVRSFLRVPRTKLHLSPAWEIFPVLSQTRCQR